MVLLHLTEKRAIFPLSPYDYFRGEREREEAVLSCCLLLPYGQEEKKRNITRLEKGVVAVERTFAVKDQTKT